MKKLRKIIYWVATLWLSLGLVSTGIVQLMQSGDGVGGADMMKDLGYPLYLLTLLGILKLLATAVLLMPRLILAKQWAYAGVFFLVVGAIYSHIAVAGGFVKILPALLIGILLIISWIYLPDNRKVSVDLVNKSI